jgi:hypothetical protein
MSLPIVRAFGADRALAADSAAAAGFPAGRAEFPPEPVVDPGPGSAGPMASLVLFRRVWRAAVLS